MIAKLRQTGIVSLRRKAKLELQAGFEYPKRAASEDKARYQKQLANRKTY